jgi:hypothetical protein
MRKRNGSQGTHAGKGQAGSRSHERVPERKCGALTLRPAKAQRQSSSTSPRPGSSRGRW